ncbi:MAG: hypothetical protein EOS58_26925 [Mesorhizobium sp.]|nr:MULTISPECIES: hypothetical protein [unclassified Mesorhizobium]AZO47745.1 hypothetical protein EJ073_07825 [Mesorhizobium sp. M4B.F.Ca.ET.058.02.1.1]RVC42717.1 hypothetical protein EN781_21195 [Mesorhizobium sp. M4A.F.Ca.ET.090.04.2.1]RVD25015.1 hypothetical protein EN742_35965 [Mesorhizobium sp. M4A.F.Ca.ET.020.02.1.1]RWC18855.1 MAG: hypothetical protein EOS53_15480 [Mesorhizobium sp.]RWC54646.1 MAG: hypothetical protein EOS54_09980 [Mesorhizobium sp.]
MPRYATIITADDGHDVVSAIGVFEGTAKPLRSGRVEEVAPGVLIGMVRGGPVDAVGGFGFPNGAEGGRMIGIASTARPGKAEPAAVQIEAAPAGTAASAESAAPKPARKPTKPRRAKTGKRRKPAVARSRPSKSAVVPAAVPGSSEPAASHG